MKLLNDELTQQLHPKPLVDGKGKIGDLYKKANFAATISSIVLMAMADTVMERGHDLISLSKHIRPHFKRRLKLAGIPYGKQAYTNIPHLTNRLSKENGIFIRYNKAGQRISGLDQSPTLIRLKEHIAKENFYVEVKKHPEVSDCFVDPRFWGLKLDVRAPYLVPPSGLVMI